MTFVSYAQNFEDVMLWRALKHVEHGFYIDVGANDPIMDSVTHAFYEKGWHGINIEPLETHFLDLQQNRPHDINLKCAVGASPGKLDLWECDVRGWATANERVVNQHSKNGHKGVYRTVDVLTLSKICEQYAPGPIHFLKIDVEGFEQDVLEGMDFVRFRPWIVVIESIYPNSTEEIHGEWEGILIAASYMFAYADGINRFYVAEEEQQKLLHFFRYPPNEFDKFVRADVVRAESRAQQIEARAQQSEARAQQSEARAQQSEARAQQAEACAQQAEARAQQAEARARELEQRIATAEADTHKWWQLANEWHEQVVAFHNSTCWKITKPLRAIKRVAGGIFSLSRRVGAGVILKAKQILRPVVAMGVRKVFLRPQLRTRISSLLKKFPWLHQRLRRVAVNTGVIYSGTSTLAQQNTVTAQSLDATTQAMTLRAQKIYCNLKTEIEKRKRGQR